MEERERLEKSWSCDADDLCGVRSSQAVFPITELEKQHYPSIDAPALVGKESPFEVRIDVGKLMPHPNDPDHFIEWIELYAGDTFLGRTQFSAGSSYPTALFKVSLSHSRAVLNVLAKCNKYGIWKNSKPLLVK